MTRTNRKFYTTRTKKNHTGRIRHEVYVPSARNGAWLPLDEKALGAEVMQYLLDESNTEPWKVFYLEGLYEEFRASENKRKKKRPQLTTPTKK